MSSSRELRPNHMVIIHTVIMLSNSNKYKKNNSLKIMIYWLKLKVLLVIEMHAKEKIELPGLC